MNHNYTAPSLAAEIAMIDAAMAEMRNVHPPLTRSDCRRLIRAALAAAAPEARCTCPSGDGSLRWPCPDHPPRRQVDAVGVMTYGEAAAAIGINSAIRRIEAGDAGGALAPLRGVARVLAAAAPHAPTTTSEEDADGRAFRTAARLGLTLRMHGGCAQSGMPGSPSAYEVVDGEDRAAAMREAVARAEAVIAASGESQRLQTAAGARQEGGAA